MVGMIERCAILWRCIWVALFLLVAANSATAQDTLETDTVDPAREVVPEGTFAAPVEVDSEVLFYVRGSTALPADERAEIVADRIIAIAESSEDGPVSVTIERGEFGEEVRVNGRMVTVVTDADAEFEQFDRDVLAGLHGEAIETAILAHREQRSTTARVNSALAAFGWTVLFVLLTWAFSRYRIRLGHHVGNFVEARFTGVEQATQEVVKGQAVGALARYIVQVTLWLLLFVALYYYLSFVLLSFAETRGIAQILLTYVSEPLYLVLQGIVSYLPNLITLAIIAIVTRFAIRGLKLFFENLRAGTIKLNNFEDHWITPTFMIARVVIILIAVAFAYPFIPGSDSAAFQGLTILAGIMVSLGSNTVVSNMMAGLFVIYRRSTKIGDRIKVGDQFGDVVEIRLMETLIKSVKNEMISIPNAQLLNSEVVNYSRKIDGRGMLVHTTVGIGYEEPQDKVEAMLIEAARRTDGLKKSPEPFVLWTGLADFAINYQINAFTTRGASLPKLLSDLHKNIVTVFNENGVQIMTPSYEADPETPKIAPAAWDGQLARVE